MGQEELEKKKEEREVNSGVRKLEGSREQEIVFPGLEKEGK